MSGVAYNANDPLQSGFLADLAQGETGGSSYAATEGVGGTNLAGYATDANGFPIWSGLGNSHAAGTYQFQPGTWAGIAQEYHLNFGNSSDQAAGAWYLAQEADPNLENDLQTGNYSKIQSALKSIWPSVTGNASNPTGLAATLGSYLSGTQSSAAATTTADNESGGPTSGTTAAGVAAVSSSPGILSSLAGGSFARIALIVVGAVIIFVALWFLLSNQGIVPGPKQAGKALLT